MAIPGLRTELPNNNSSISAIRLKSGSIAVIYNPVRFNDDISKTVWPVQRCPVEIAVSEDEGISWPYRRMVEMGEGFTGPRNDDQNRRYEYPVLMQGKDGVLHAAYRWGKWIYIHPTVKNASRKMISDATTRKKQISGSRTGHCAMCWGLAATRLAAERRIWTFRRRGVGLPTITRLC